MLKTTVLHGSRSLRHAAIEVGDVLGGIALGTTHWQFNYAQALRTKEFKGQVKASVFGSISATLYY